MANSTFDFVFITFSPTHDSSAVAVVIGTRGNQASKINRPRGGKVLGLNIAAPFTATKSEGDHEEESARRPRCLLMVSTYDGLTIRPTQIGVMAGEIDRAMRRFFPIFFGMSECLRTNGRPSAKHAQIPIPVWESETEFRGGAVPIEFGTESSLITHRSSFITHPSSRPVVPGGDGDLAIRGQSRR
jgi:hypothetical protein